MSNLKRVRLSKGGTIVLPQFAIHDCSVGEQVAWSRLENDNTGVVLLV